MELYGTAVPPTAWRQLRAGPLSARFEEGNLRYVTFHDDEVLRAVSFVVRDKDWGTYAPTIDDLLFDEQAKDFVVTYRASCRGPAATLNYTARIEGHADGRLRFATEAVPDGEFETNRCGFVVLHPASVAGGLAFVEHCDGRRAATTFPDLIDPWRPFLSIRAIRHHAGGGFEVACRLEGDEFEMEDQRNWSDASFKTYGRPLELPWPFMLPAGVPVRQSVDLAIRPLAPPAEPRPADISQPAPAGATLPQIGLVIRPDEIADALRLRDRLVEVGPQRILCAYDPTVGNDAAAIAAFAELQAAYPAAYDLEYVVVGIGDLDAELSQVAAAVRRSGLRLASIAVCPAVDRQSTPPGSAWPACPPLEAVYAAARRSFPDTLLGGGMFSFFTELNRKRPPLAPIDFVTHATNPIVHAADDTSVMETLETLPHITRSARAIIGGKPYRIGPSTIAMRMNPYGSRTMMNPGGGRVCMTDDDPRQRGRFAAAWCAGYAAAIATADIEVWVPAAFTGPRGLVEPGTGNLLPVGKVVAELATLAGAGVISARVSLAERRALLEVGAGTTTTMTANLGPLPQPEDGDLQPFEVRFRRRSTLQLGTASPLAR